MLPRFQEPILGQVRLGQVRLGQVKVPRIEEAFDTRNLLPSTAFIQFCLPKKMVSEYFKGLFIQLKLFLVPWVPIKQKTKHETNSKKLKAFLFIHSMQLKVIQILEDKVYKKHIFLFANIYVTNIYLILLQKQGFYVGAKKSFILC